MPPECARDKDFDLSKFTGRWYITAGLNPLFDTFPCQEHFFGVPEPGRVFCQFPKSHIWLATMLLDVASQLPSKHIQLAALLFAVTSQCTPFVMDSSLSLSSCRHAPLPVVLLACAPACGSAFKSMSMLCMARALHHTGILSWQRCPGPLAAVRIGMVWPLDVSAHHAAASACAAGLLYGKINWRVPKADGDFLQRGVVQTFRQQDEKDILLNHGSASFCPS